jgi:hypothetical protein
MAIDDLNDLHLFGRVVEAGSFAAAERSSRTFLTPQHAAR